MHSTYHDLRFMVIGLNHITAPVKVRDQVHLSTREALSLSKQLIEAGEVNEAVVLCTCNRSEVYIAYNKRADIASTVIKRWADIRSLKKEEISSHFYTFDKMDAVQHLLRVICSLDSMIVGENQIFGQVKEAYELAVKHNTVDFFFNYIFQTAFRIGKKVRTDTSLNEGAVSVSYAAVELTKKILGVDLDSLTVGIVGSGEMGELASMHFQNAGVTKFHFFNRSISKAEKLAARFGGDIHELSALEGSMGLCDIIISATAASGLVITQSMVRQAIKQKSNAELLLIDIAAPRDIEESCGELEQVFVFTIDDLKKVVSENKQQRQNAASQAEEIICLELENIERWQKNLALNPIIIKLRKKYNALAGKELEKALKGQPEGYKKDLERVCRGLVNKFTHEAIMGIKRLSDTGGANKASQYINLIFDLGDEQPAPNTRYNSASNSSSGNTSLNLD